MFKRSGRTFLILASFALVVFVSGLLIKGLIVEDTQRYLENEYAILLLWSLFITALALGMGMLISRKPSGAGAKSDQSAVAGGNADLNKAPLLDEKADAVQQPGTAVSEPMKGTTAPGKPKASKAVVEEKEPESEPDEPEDADDEDMQPLPGDANRITTVVKGLDKLAKAQGLRNSLHKEPLELAEFLNKIMEKTRASVPDKDILFSLECGSGLRLSADPACLSGIMENLLDNAVKAVKKDGTVTVSAAADGDQVVFEVKDTGTGIRRKNVPHVFEQFYRGAGSGIGLGLTIVKELVDACGGTIDVQSTRGKGSIFIVSIPSS